MKQTKEKRKLPILRRLTQAKQQIISVQIKVISHKIHINANQKNIKNTRIFEEFTIVHKLCEIVMIDKNKYKAAINIV